MVFEITTYITSTALYTALKFMSVTFFVPGISCLCGTETDLSPITLTGRWPAMVYLSPKENFVDHVFLKAYYLACILQHVSYLSMGALPSTACYIRYPTKRIIP